MVLTAVPAIRSGSNRSIPRVDEGAVAAGSGQRAQR